MVFRIAMIRIAKKASSKTLYKNIEDHYGLITLKNNEKYVNVFTTKPFGSYIKIADNCIDPDIMTFEFSEKADLYFLQHKEKFSACLTEITYVQ